jgi:hypothetical protein
MERLIPKVADTRFKRWMWEHERDVDEVCEAVVSVVMSVRTPVGLTVGVDSDLMHQLLSRWMFRTS